MLVTFHVVTRSGNVKLCIDCSSWVFLMLNTLLAYSWIALHTCASVVTSHPNTCAAVVVARGLIPANQAHFCHVEIRHIRPPARVAAYVIASNNRRLSLAAHAAKGTVHNLPMPHTLGRLIRIFCSGGLVHAPVSPRPSFPPECRLVVTSLVFLP